MKKLLFILSIILFVSCAESDRKQAEKLFFDAQNFYSENNFDAAKNAIDTLHARFPRQVEFRRKCDTLAWKITIDEIARELPQIDSTLVGELAEAEKIAKNFKFFKDDKYQQIGDYEHISMNTAANAGRNYLKPITDEYGNFRFVSTLVGQKINHRAVSATVGDLSAETQKAAENSINGYSDGITSYETVLFNTETAKNFILFLCDNIDNQVKITLLGDKNYSYNLSKKDLKIFVETFNFSLLLKNINENQQKKTALEQTFKALKLKI
ncbi:MAG: hypothetical protein LBN95_04700 [Prevotellaceae bacterium]|jgi:hypothetical protein|nr:hypothetical protein [Prevotellaceae bacterium]